MGDGAVVDPEFNTTDVSIIVKTDWLTGKYARHYYRDTANRDEGSSPEGARPAETRPEGAGGTRAGGRHSDGES